MSEQRTGYVYMRKFGPAFGDERASRGLSRAVDELGGLPEPDPRPLARRAEDRSARETIVYDLMRRLVVQGHRQPAVGYVWCRVRAWAFSLAWPDQRVALDVVDGPGPGWLVELARSNAAQLDGWCVLRVTPAQVADGTAVRLVVDALATREAGRGG